MKEMFSKPAVTQLETRLVPSAADLVGLHFAPVVQASGDYALVLQESQGSLNQAQLDQVTADNNDGDVPILFAAPGGSTTLSGVFTDPRPNGMMIQSYVGMYTTSAGMMNGAPHDDPDAWGGPVDGFYSASNSLLNAAYQAVGLSYTPGEVADPPAAPTALDKAQKRADELMVEQLALTSRAVNRAAAMTGFNPIRDFFFISQYNDAIIADAARAKGIVKEWNSLKAAWGPTAFPPRVNRVHDADTWQFVASYTVSRDYAVGQVSSYAAQSIAYSVAGNTVMAAACQYEADRFSNAIAVWDAAHP